MALLVTAALLLGLIAVPGDPVSAQNQAQQSVAERCFERHQFGAQPVDVAKTADGQTVLAQTSWGYHDSIGCYLSLDDSALAALRAAPPPQELPSAATQSSQRCFEHHLFGAQPVDVAKTADGQTVLARLSWGHHSTIGCYLVLDDTALATLRAARTTDVDTGQTDTDTPKASPRSSPIAAGGSHSCAIRTDHTIACWGDNRHGQTDPPPGQYTTIAAGLNHSCAIRTDHTIACWGDNRHGQTDPPPGQYTTIAAAAHGAHSCALRTDHTIACWGGNNRHGQTDPPSGQFTATTTGTAHSCALRTDHTIACWGENRHGEAHAPSGQYTAIAAGGSYSCALRTDQTINCWGYNQDGWGRTDAPPGQFTTIATGGGHSCAIRTNQAIACWGGNHSGKADAPTGQYTAIATGGEHSCAVRANQAIACWGDNQYGQTTVPFGLRRTQEETLSVEVSSETEAKVKVGRSFEVTVEFNRAVSGFDAHDMKVVNGDVTHFSGSGSTYEATVTAAELGTVVVLIPSAVAQDQSGHSNEPSQPFVRTVRTAVTTPNQFFDTWNRETVLAGFTAEFDRQEPDHGWTGDLARCIAGTTSQEYRDSVFQRMNWYRQMTGVLPLVEDRELSKFAQIKAMMLAAEDRLSHRPTPDWACYTSIPRYTESIASTSGITSIDLYMRDSGSNNEAVGHRRMITDGRLELFGTGDIPGRANTLHAQYSSAQREIREPRSFMAWPSPGYIPYTVVWGRWSFTLPWADFSDATVVVVDDNGVVQTEIIHNRDSALVWAMDGDTDSLTHVRPRDGDRCYVVTISGVKIEGETQPPYEYVTCVFDPYQ